MGRSLAIALIVTALFAVLSNHSASAGSKTAHILVDASRSMEGYKNTGELDALLDRYTRTLESTGSTPTVDVFTSSLKSPMRLTQYSYWSASPSWGNTTELSAALRARRLDADVVILITDNVSDPDAAGTDADSREFYQQLKSWRKQQTWLVLHRIGFDGSVFLPRGISLVAGKPIAASAEEARAQLQSENSQSGTVGRLVQRSLTYEVSYKGMRALAAYVFVVNDAGLSVGQVISERIGSDSAMPLLLEPMDPRVLDPRPTASVAASPCDPDPSHPIGSPNLILDASRQNEVVLLPADGFSYDPTQPTELRCNVRFVSLLEHVQVGSLERGDCSGAAQVSLPYPPKLQAKDDLKSMVAGIVVSGWQSPNRLLGDPSDPAANVATQIGLSIPALIDHSVPRSMIADNVRLVGTIQVDVPGTAFRLSDKARGRYFTAHAGDLTRLYSPQDPIQFLAPAEVSLTIPFRVTSDVFVPARAIPPSRFGWGALLLLLAASSVLWWLLAPLGILVTLEIKEGDQNWESHTVRVGGLVGAPWHRPVLTRSGRVRLLVRREVSWRPGVMVRRDDDEETLLLTRRTPERVLSSHDGTTPKIHLRWKQ